MKRFFLILVSGFIIGGCSTSPININSNIPNIFDKDKIIIQSTSNRIENLVDQKRIENLMAILTGKIPTSNGLTVGERGTPEGRDKARIFISSYLESIGYKVEHQKYNLGYNTGENLVAILPASKETQEYILVGAHFDTVRTVGADDNGSGSVVVMEVANVLRNLKDRQVNLIFAFFDQEERGLIGSKYMAEEYKKQGLKINSVHTLDMVGWDSDKDKAVEIERPAGNLWDYYVMVNKVHNLGILLQRTSSGSTDHESFQAKGFNSVGLCEEWVHGDTTPHYHKKTDTYETINFEYLTSTAKLVCATLNDLSLKISYKTNPFIPHDQFPGRDREFVDF